MCGAPAFFKIILAKGPTTMFYLHGRITRLINVWQTLNLLDPHSNIYFQSTNWLHAFLCFEIHLLATIFKVECARDVTRPPQDNPLVSSRYKTTASPLESMDKCRFIATSRRRSCNEEGVQCRNSAKPNSLAKASAMQRFSAVRFANFFN